MLLEKRHYTNVTLEEAAHMAEYFKHETGEHNHTAEEIQQAVTYMLASTDCDQASRATTTYPHPVTGALMESNHTSIHDIAVTYRMMRGHPQFDVKAENFREFFRHPTHEWNNIKQHILYLKRVYAKLRYGLDMDAVYEHGLTLYLQNKAKAAAASAAASASALAAAASIAAMSSSAPPLVKKKKRRPQFNVCDRKQKRKTSKLASIAAATTATTSINVIDIDEEEEDHSDGDDDIPTGLIPSDTTTTTATIDNASMIKPHTVHKLFDTPETTGISSTSSTTTITTTTTTTTATATANDTKNERSKIRKQMQRVKADDQQDDMLLWDLYSKGLLERASYLIRSMTHEQLEQRVSSIYNRMYTRTTILIFILMEKARVADNMCTVSYLIQTRYFPLFERIGCNRDMEYLCDKSDRIQRCCDETKRPITETMDTSKPAVFDVFHYWTLYKIIRWSLLSKLNESTYTTWFHPHIKWSDLSVYAASFTTEMNEMMHLFYKLTTYSVDPITTPRGISILPLASLALNQASSSSSSSSQSQSQSVSSSVNPKIIKMSMNQALALDNSSTRGSFLFDDNNIMVSLHVGDEQMYTNSSHAVEEITWSLFDITRMLKMAKSSDVLDYTTLEQLFNTRAINALEKIESFRHHMKAKTPNTSNTSLSS